MRTPKLGQHFLIDQDVIQKIVEVADLAKDDTVLEVGPGKGILTKALVEKAGRVIAIEKDGELHHKLKKRFKDAGNISLVHGDVRDFDPASIKSDYKVVANIPYYLTGRLLQALFASAHPPRAAVLMLQNEVADRLTAPKGQSSLLQLTTQVFAEVEKAFFVPKDKFSPPPEVDSAVVVFKLRPVPLVAPQAQRVFFRFLKFAFAGKRKKLVNTLSAALGADRILLTGKLAELKLSENARPQELDIKDWLALYKKVIEESKFEK